MPYSRPTLTDLRQQVLQSINTARITGPTGTVLTNLLQKAVLRVIANAQAGLSYEHYGFIDWISLQAVPWTATDEFLEGWAKPEGCHPQAGAIHHRNSSLHRGVWDGRSRVRRPAQRWCGLHLDGQRQRGQRLDHGAIRSRHPGNGRQFRRRHGVHPVHPGCRCSIGIVQLDAGHGRRRSGTGRRPPDADAARICRASAGRFSAGLCRVGACGAGRHPGMGRTECDGRWHGLSVFHDG